MPCRNSSAAVQQAQPFCSSTVSSAADAPPVFLDTSAASMLISATSLTRRPTLSPALFSSRCLSSVVFPAPRKPESSVMGVVAGSSAFSVESTIRVGFRRSTAIRRLTGSSPEHTQGTTGPSRGRPSGPARVLLQCRKTKRSTAFKGIFGPHLQKCPTYIFRHPTLHTFKASTPPSHLRPSRHIPRVRSRSAAPPLSRRGPTPSCLARFPQTSDHHARDART